ncbi:hypothetical protein ALC56_02867 [Trachymyrmex septentrionalis]|uniref:Uncharacterized protein n=1 Tax=Trachymyrmex septentrionalis TaxID=34720 RepID=A0A151JZX1_9HYME|nr:hypothetical protein ALC56_02867 [Trachymyrmex septentrionalis]
MDQDSDEKVLSDDIGYASDLSEHNTDHAEKFVPSPEIRALNGRTKHCMIQCYYTTGGILNVCATCMIHLADTDCRNVSLLERVRDAVKRHVSVKVNTTFNGELATNNIRANKSIITKNIEIYQYTDLREWYEQHITEATLTSLEEFQERDSGWALSRILNDYQCEQTKSHARGMLYQSAMGNYT